MLGANLWTIERSGDRCGVKKDVSREFVFKIKRDEFFEFHGCGADEASSPEGKCDYHCHIHEVLDEKPPHEIKVETCKQGRARASHYAHECAQGELTYDLWLVLSNIFVDSHR